jgi:hypothetical protein
MAKKVYRISAFQVYDCFQEHGIRNVDQHTCDSIAEYLSEASKNVVVAHRHGLKFQRTGGDNFRVYVKS